VQGRRRGRRGPVDKLLEEWAPRVYRFALRLCDDAHAAEDLTQETFLRAWRQRARLRDERAARVWLFRITANLWRDHLRRRRSPVGHAGPLNEDKASRAQPAEQLASEKEELQRALEALAELPPRQREVLYLGACEGLSTAEISEILGGSADAVKTNLSLARKKIRERLSEPVPGPIRLG
jgi:RNA polymerase sigma-70 factor (ECF subfamily)